jgi:hypothetical protein
MFGLCLSFDFLETRKQNVCFHSQVRWEDTLLRPLERANFNRWILTILHVALEKQAFSKNVTISSLNFCFSQKPTVSHIFHCCNVCLSCRDVTCKWNNEMSQLEKKIKPHQAAAGTALVCNYSICIEFSILGTITGA